MRSPTLAASLLAVASLAVAALAAAGPATGATDRLTVRTSLGPIDDGSGTRDLRARGRAPRGSRVVVRFYRGSRRIGARRPRLDGTRYSAARPISRTGEYTVRVVATRRGRPTLRVSAKLTYGPTAEAPAADDSPPAGAG